MKIDSFNIHDGDAGLAPGMQPLLRLRVLGAWTHERTLYVHFERDYFLQAEATPAVGTKALMIKVGHTKPGASFDFLNEKPEVEPFPPLIGRRFTGMDANILTFGSVGARITLDGVQWVREA